MRIAVHRRELRLPVARIVPRARPVTVLRLPGINCRVLGRRADDRRHAPSEPQLEIIGLLADVLGRGEGELGPAECRQLAGIGQRHRRHVIRLAGPQLELNRVAVRRQRRDPPPHRNLMPVHGRQRRDGDGGRMHGGRRRILSRELEPQHPRLPIARRSASRIVRRAQCRNRLGDSRNLSPINAFCAEKRTEVEIRPCRRRTFEHIEAVISSGLVALSIAEHIAVELHRNLFETARRHLEVEVEHIRHAAAVVGATLARQQAENRMRPLEDDMSATWIRPAERRARPRLEGRIVDGQRPRLAVDEELIHAHPRSARQRDRIHCRQVKVAQIKLRTVRELERAARLRLPTCIAVEVGVVERKPGKAIILMTVQDLELRRCTAICCALQRQRTPRVELDVVDADIVRQHNRHIRTCGENRLVVRRSRVVIDCGLAPVRGVVPVLAVTFGAARPGVIHRPGRA